MKKSLLLIAALGCFVGSAANAQSIFGGNQTYNQPQGGQGGAGGNGLGVGVGVGVGIAAGGNSNATGGAATVGDIRNTNTATALGGTGGSVVGSGNSANANTNTNANVNTTANSNNARQNVTVEGDRVNYEAQARNPVATAYAAPMIASNGTCFGSASIGAQGVGFGVSLGSTKFDENCDARYDSQELRALGHRAAAVARMCQKAANADAMAAAGTPCPGKGVASSSGTVPSNVVTSPQATSNERYTDPIIRARLGLPPLANQR